MDIGMILQQERNDISLAGNIDKVYHQGCGAIIIIRIDVGPMLEKEIGAIRAGKHQRRPPTAISAVRIGPMFQKESKRRGKVATGGAVYDAAMKPGIGLISVIT